MPADWEARILSVQAAARMDSSEIEKLAEYKQIWDFAYPDTALYLLQYLSELIDSNVITADEAALDIPELAVLQAALKFDKTKANGLSFIGFCRYVGKTVAWNHVPESCPVSFLSKPLTTEETTEDHRYKWALRLKMNSFRDRYYTKHGEFPTEESTAEAFRVSSKMVRSLLSLTWFSLNDPQSSDSSALIGTMTSAESGIIDMEERESARVRFSELGAPTKKKIGVAGVLSLLDGRKRELNAGDIELLETALNLLDWPEEQKAFLKRRLSTGASRHEVAKTFMGQLHKSDTKESIRQLRHQLKKDLRKELKTVPSG
jgi:hypothetical protein